MQEVATSAATQPKQCVKPYQGVALIIDGVSVRAAGHTILDQISLSMAPGEHVAIVGPSGAGKSTLVGLLLGWHRPATGRVTVDGERLEGERVEQLRKQTAWVDPSVHLWNRSLLSNLEYGNRNDHHLPVAEALREAELGLLMEKLPQGLQTRLGESGALVSGGEGQRVRLARALLRPDARLMILDEPFTGLDRAQRRKLLAHACSHWTQATLHYSRRG
jgi:ATP-binding cassette subfamily B protein